MDIDAEIRRVAKLLETEIHVAGSSKRAVEKKLGVAAGYLTKVVKGGLELRLRHVLEVAEATGFDVAEFFQKAFPPKTAATSGRREAGVSPGEIAEMEERLRESMNGIRSQLAEIRQTQLAERSRTLPEPQAAAARRSGEGRSTPPARATTRRARPPRR